MKESNQTIQILSWICQLIAAAILAFAAWGKITGAEMSIYIFTQVGMEPSGRIIIGIVEASAAILLLTPNLPQIGAFLGFGTMLGAIIAHFTILGIEVSGDGGRLVMLLCIVVVCTTIVMYIRRKKLPFIGTTFD